jgi:hypothetical protein
MKSTIPYLLKNSLALPLEDWTVQGFGLLRLRIDDHTRLHIWHSRFRVPDVSDVHDHAQWAFQSTVLAGMLVNVRFVYSVPTQGPGSVHGAVIKCGADAGIKERLLAGDLVPGAPELYLPGGSYSQEPSEIHRTFAADGTVTLIIQDRREVDTARVFWPAGALWVSARPRPATEQEVSSAVGSALAIWPQ